MINRAGCFPRDVAKGGPGRGEGNFEQCDLHEINTLPHAPFYLAHAEGAGARGGGACKGGGRRASLPANRQPPLCSAARNKGEFDPPISY